MLRTAVAGAYPIVRRLGVEKAFSSSSWRNRRLLVLCWHGISRYDEHLWNGGLYITPELFRRRLEVLRDGNYSVLHLDDALNRLQANDLPPRSVAITFDDGFCDFAVHAVPMLREFGFPATLYLTTYYVDHQQPVTPVIFSYILWKGCGEKRRLRDGTPVTTPEEAQMVSNRILEDADRRNLSGAERNDLARALADDLEVDFDAILRRRTLHIMNAEEIREAISDGLITIEAHTHRHRTPPQADLIVREFNDNDARIQDITGRRPRHFCYPSGVVRPEYFELFKQQGYLSATTCQSGMATRASNPYLIPRLLDHSCLTDMYYRGWLSGLFGALDTLRKSS